MFDCIWVQESVASLIVQMRNESKLQKYYCSPYIAHGDKNANWNWPAVRAFLQGGRVPLLERLSYQKGQNIALFYK